MRAFPAISFDTIEARLERRADLLGSATGMLIGVISEGREFTAREQDAWDYAAARADELGAECDSLMGLLAELGYRFPRPVHWRTGGKQQ